MDLYKAFDLNYIGYTTDELFFVCLRVRDQLAASYDCLVLSRIRRKTMGAESESYDRQVSNFNNLPAHA